MFLFGRLCLIKAVLCLLLVVLCLFVVVLFLYGMLTAVLKACVSQFSQSANCSINILYTVEIKTQRNKGTACPRQILTRKEFKNWHVWRLRVEPDTDVMAKLFISMAFFTGFQAHFSELREALEFGSGGIMLCRQ